MSVLTAPAPPRRSSAPGGLRGAVRRRPLLSFFVLALGASWIAWLPYILSNNGLGVWDFTFPGGLAGGQLLGMLPGAYLGPIGAALTVTAIADGRAGLRAWARRLWNWRVSWTWYVGILLSVPGAMILAGLVFSGGDVRMPPVAALVSLVPGLLVQMVTTGLAEEPGWRDFALPRMQRRIGALGASLAIGVLWGVWHLPLFLTQWGEYPDASAVRIGAFVGFCMLFNVVMTWVFNRTGQSLPMAMLLHVSLNNFSGVWAEMFPWWDTETFQIILLAGSAVAAAVVLAATRGRLGLDATRSGAEPEVQPSDVVLPPVEARLS